MKRKASDFYGDRVTIAETGSGLTSFKNVLDSEYKDGGIARLLLIPGQREGKSPTHVAHIHMTIFIKTTIFFSKYVVLLILHAR